MKRLPQGGFLLTLFMTGLFVGMILMNLGKSILLENTGLLDEYTLYHMKYMTVDGSALFCYILKKRMGRALGIAVLSTTYLGMAVCVGAVFGYGFSMGAFLAAAVMRYGIKGLALVAVGIFPQYLVYLPAGLALLGWCMGLYRAIYLDRSVLPDAGSRRILLKKALQLMGILLAFTAGCLLEGLVNPHLMLGLLKIF